MHMECEMEMFHPLGSLMCSAGFMMGCLLDVDISGVQVKMTGMLEERSGIENINTHLLKHSLFRYFDIEGNI